MNSADARKRMSGIEGGFSAEVGDLLRRAQTEYNAGRLAPAASLYEKVLGLHPGHPEASNSLGVITGRLGMFDVAADLLAGAIQAEPDNPSYHNNLGNVLREQGRPEDALASFDRAVALKPDYAEAHGNRGIALAALGRVDDAVACYRIAIGHRPDFAEVHNNLGAALTSLGRVEEAIAAYGTAIAIRPDYTEAHNDLGSALKQGGRLGEAIASYDRAIAIRPDYAEAHYNRGLVLQNQGRLEEAAESCRRAIAIRPDYTEAHNNLGVILFDMWRLDDAIASYRQAIALRPDYAEAHNNLALGCLAAGRLREGLAEYEWRWGMPAFRSVARGNSFKQPQWDGVADLTGKTILVWGEQGLGDEILWSAFVPEIVARAGRCIVECTSKLVPLLSRSFPGAEVRPTDRTRDGTRTDFDLHVPMGSLFRVLGAEAPRTGVFLFPDPRRVAFWKSRLSSLGTGPFIGMAWTSSVVDSTRSQAYTRLEDWAPVLETPRAVFVNLQHGNRRADVAEAKERFGVVVHDFADLDLFDDLMDVAALVVALDVVVTIATAVAAIAAGVGTPTWRMMWRRDNNNNVLYALPGPSVAYFHRDTGEPWDEAFAAVRRRLDQGRLTGA